MPDTLYEVNPMRCPQCRGEDFTASEEAEVRISGSEVVELTHIDLDSNSSITCEDCGFSAKGLLFNPKIQDDMTKEQLLGIVASYLKRQSGDRLAELATKLLEVHVVRKGMTNNPDGEEVECFAILEKDRKGKK